jgi:predicted AAA+ superfamily ATPase
MKRVFFHEQINEQFEVHSVCALLGPRQIGKTTLAKEYAAQFANTYVFDLENPTHLTRLEDPMLALADIEANLIVIDEIQRRPELFPVLRVLVDERPRKFLILGSASRDLIQQSSETLAGRIGYIELTTFSASEGAEENKLWLQGGFPRSYLASSKQSYLWRKSYITTFLERDISTLGYNIPPMLMRKLWMMVAHYHGQILNASEIGKSLSISYHTVKKYMDILEGTFMVRMLQPWFENISKRQIKSAKLYIRDSGLLHALLDIRDAEQLQVHPKLGSSWEGFALEEIIKEYHALPEECYFWATQAGAELDLLIIKDGKKIGFEFKYTDAPKITLSMRIAIETLKLDHLYIIFPYKEDSFPLAEQITARGLSREKNIR